MATTTHIPNYVNPETRVPELLGVQIGLTVLAFLIVSARVYTRTKIMRFWGTDDLAISVAMVSWILFLIYMVDCRMLWWRETNLGL